MENDRIERDVLVAAQIETVWDVITRPEHIPGWFADEVEMDFLPGGHGEFRFTGREGRRAVTLRFVIDAIEAPHRFALHWTGHPSEPTDDHPWASVEYTLQSEGGGTRLRVVETGIASCGLSGQELADYYAGHEGGWEMFLAQIATYAPSVAKQTA